MSPMRRGIALRSRRPVVRPAPRGAGAGRRVGARTGWHRVALAAALAVLAVLWLLPAVWMGVTSLKPTEHIIRVPPEWIPWPATLGHYREVLFSSSRTARIGRAFLNSVVVSLGSVLVVLVTSAMAAYPLARMRFPGRDLVFTVVVGSLMIPNAIVLVPQYVLTQRLGWLSTYQGLIVPEAAMTFAFGVFLLRQFFLTIPGEIEDAARIDGAGSWQIFARVVLPLSQPVLAALAIFAFRSAWNDFLWPLIAVNKPDMFPLPVALSFLRGAYSSESYGPIMAGATLSALPLLVVFVVANRRIVEGVRVSGLKG
jgi:multiple sugar transport system permease protein